MSLEAETEGPAAPAGIPEPEFAVAEAAHVPFSAAPTIRFTALATEPAGVHVQSIALTVQVMIDPGRRGYDPATRTRLDELFGPAGSGAASTSSLAWARVGAVVPGFRSTTTFGIEVPCTYDLEVAAAKYFYALADGEVPLSFHFNGNIFYRDRERRLQMVPVAWSSTAQYRMSIQVWKAMIAEHYPNMGWIRVGEDTLTALQERRAARGLSSFDDVVRELLESAQ